MGNSNISRVETPNEAIPEDRFKRRFPHGRLVSMHTTDIGFIVANMAILA